MFLCSVIVLVIMTGDGPGLMADAVAVTRIPDGSAGAALDRLVNEY